jgi:hypothetical protein
MIPGGDVLANTVSIQGGGELLDLAGGGGLAFLESSPTLTDCVVSMNELAVTTEDLVWGSPIGGGLCCHESSPSITSCTFDGNVISGDPDWERRGGIALADGSHAIVENSIVSFSVEGGGVRCDSTSTAMLTCCDVYGNEGGDWVDCLDGQEGEANGNFAADPLLCAPPEYRGYTLNEDSPCLPDNHPYGCEWCGLIGANGMGCTATGIDEEEHLTDVLFLDPGVPNPFGASTLVTYAVPSQAGSSPVQLRIYDPAGRLVRTLVDAVQPAGIYEISWEGRNDRGEEVAAGVYLCELRVAGEAITRRVILVR